MSADKEFGLAVRYQIAEEPDIYNVIVRRLKAERDHNVGHLTYEALFGAPMPCALCDARREERLAERAALPWIDRFIDWCRTVDPSADRGDY